MKNTHKAVVIELNLDPHPNADNLSICKVGPFQVVMNTKDWEGKTKAVYIPPQNIVNTEREEFAFLKKEGKTEAVIKPIKLRRVHSYGLCVPCPEGFDIGDDLTEHFGIKHYEPEIDHMRDSFENGGILGAVSKYDIDSPFKELNEWNSDEEVIVTEKIHGQNMRVYWDGEQLHVGGRNRWFKENQNDLYWRAVRECPQIVKFCKNNPNNILYGEQYGHTKMKYGKNKNKPGFAAFDIRRPDSTYWFYDDFEFTMTVLDIPIANKLYEGIFESIEKMKSFSVGNTTYDDTHVREGCVVRSLVESKYSTGERKMFKLINPEYKG
jgi:RNA ligase (TIGR02306 family)